MTALIELNTFRKEKAEYTPIGELMDSPIALCSFLRAEIRSSGLKVGALARKANVSHTTISRMLYGETKDPRVNTVIQILRACGRNLYIR